MELGLKSTRENPVAQHRVTVCRSAGARRGQTTLGLSVLRTDGRLSCSCLWARFKEILEREARRGPGAGGAVAFRLHPVYLGHWTRRGR